MRTRRPSHGRAQNYSYRVSTVPTNTNNFEMMCFPIVPSGGNRFRTTLAVQTTCIYLGEEFCSFACNYFAVITSYKYPRVKIIKYLTPQVF